MRNWKRIIAAAGTAALLISNLGAVSQAVFGAENYTESVETPESGESVVDASADQTPEDSASDDSNIVTLDIDDLVGEVGSEGESQTAAPVADVSDGDSASENGDAGNGASVADVAETLAGSDADAATSENQTEDTTSNKEVASADQGHAATGETASTATMDGQEQGTTVADETETTGTTGSQEQGTTVADETETTGATGGQEQGTTVTSETETTGATDSQEQGTTTDGKADAAGATSSQEQDTATDHATDTADAAGTSEATNASDAATAEESADAASTSEAGDLAGEGETLADPDAVTEEENPDDSEETEDAEHYALEDSLSVTLETKESSHHDVKRDDNGDYLYNLGETAASTLTISNPEEYLLEESDGATVRLYMQFQDTAASDVDGVPYKDESKVNEDVAAADVADLLASDAADDSATDGKTPADRSVTTAAEGADAAADKEVDKSAETTADGTAKASQYNDSYGRTQKAGEHDIEATSGNTYTYTVTERGDGLYEYEFERPTHGDTYSIELTSTYGKGTTGGRNEIRVEIIPGEQDVDTSGANATSSDAEDAQDAATSDDKNEEEGTASAEERSVENSNTGDTQDDAADADEAEQQEELSTERKHSEAEIQKVCEQTLRWLADVDLVSRKTTQTAETENYIVSVTYGADTQLPTDAELRVTEYGPETEVYQRITEQTGMAYDWLLDISFYYNELELEPQAPVELKVTAQEVTEDASNEDATLVSVTSLDEDADDTDSEDDAPAETITTVTHFADAGTEVLEDHEIEVTANEEGQLETSFALGSLSLVAGQTYHSATVVNYSTAQNSSSDTFLIYKVENKVVYFLVYNSGSVATLQMSLSDLLGNVDKDSITTSDIVDLGKVIYVQNSLKGTINGASATVSWNNLCWQREGGYALRSAANSNAYLAIGNDSLGISWVIPYTVEFVEGSEERYSRLRRGTYDYGMGFQNGKFVGKKASNATSLTVARVGSDHTEEAESVGGSTAVYTGDIDRRSLGFYTVKVESKTAEDGTETQSLQPIGGVTYTVYKRVDGTDENGRPNKGDPVAYVLTADDSMHVDLPSLANGQYVMEMTSVPDGYVCDDGYWTFGISNNQLVLDLENESGKSEGVIVVNPDTNLEMDKTASVYDYENRVYQVDLTAHSDLQQATFKPLNIHLVLDQSNSMLFPSGLKAVDGVGLKVMYQNSKTTYAQIQNESSLDKNKVYYLITSPQNSSTVWALWYDKGTSKWTYQDASYYALATYKDEFGEGDYSHIRSSNTLAAFPDQDDFQGNSKSGNTYTKYVSGGRIVYETNWHGDVSSASNVHGSFSSEVSSSNETTTLTIYEAEDEYNRLHYLRQSVCEMLQMLAEMNPETTVSLDGFYATPMTCGGTYTLNDSGLNTLLNKITDITTEGGTRQDLALDKTYEDHLKNTTDKSSEYVILITDGAPAGSNYLGSATDEIGTGSSTLSDSNTVYMRLNYIADQVKNKATLATVGLSMKDVTNGRKALAHISTDGPSVSNVSGTQGDWWFQPDSSSELGKILCETILQKVIQQEVIGEKGTVVDYISDSFYPVDPQTGAAVASGTRIQADGSICKDSSGKAVIYSEAGTNPGTGTIWQDAATGSWYVQWDEADISGTTSRTETTTTSTWYRGSTTYYRYLGDSFTSNGRTYVWQTHDGVTAYWAEVKTTTEETMETRNGFSGRVYLKAKEDFIGGNAINTNGNQINTSIDEERGISSAGGAVLTLSSGGQYQYKRPTVNVRLLEMNNNYSLEIVAVGDTICSPQSDVNELLNQVVFSKIVGNDDGRVLNWRETTDDVSTMHNTQVGRNDLSLAYAGISLSDADWTTLKNGSKVTVPYTYDDAEGAVGYFTFSLIEEGATVDGVKQTPDWDDHTADVEQGRPATSETDHPYGNNWIERYTLDITYTAYRLGENGRPAQNQYNGDSGSPGTEVGSNDTVYNTVATGKGTVTSKNIHYVYAYPTYELPETGGSGTLPYELGGFAALLTSMFVGYSRRRRDRKEGEM